MELCVIKANVVSWRIIMAKSPARAPQVGFVTLDIAFDGIKHLNRKQGIWSVRKAVFCIVLITVHIV